MCNKCEKHHSELFKNHQQYKVDKEHTEIFTGLCNEKNHSDELIFFCKNHNKLCCLGCFSKIKATNYGLHKDCDICLIEDIEKPRYYMKSFYCHFESLILIQILCSSFYACRNMNIATYVSIGLFLIMNAMLIIGYYITKRIEDVNGSYEHDEPQRLMNILFNAILLFLNTISLFKCIIYNKNSKLYYIININNFYYSRII